MYTNINLNAQSQIVEFIRTLNHITYHYIQLYKNYYIYNNYTTVNINVNCSVTHIYVLIVRNKLIEDLLLCLSLSLCVVLASSCWTEWNNAMTECRLKYIGMFSYRSQSLIARERFCYPTHTLATSPAAVPVSVRDPPVRWMGIVSMCDR